MLPPRTGALASRACYTAVDSELRQLVKCSPEPLSCWELHPVFCEVVGWRAIAPDNRACAERTSHSVANFELKTRPFGCDWGTGRLTIRRHECGSFIREFVQRVHLVHREGPDAMNLNRHLGLGPPEVRRLCRQERVVSYR